MRFGFFNKNGQSGVIHTLPLLVIIAAVGIISFLLISSTVPFSSGIFQKLNPKPASQAAYVNNLNLPTNLPLCSTVGVIHDRTKWHSLVHFQNSDDPADPNRGNPICHYDHTHGMNPNDPTLVNKTVNTPTGPVAFGPVNPAFTNNQTISYPWQTFKGAGENFPSPPPNFADMENGFKHNFYTWLNRINMPCISSQPDQDACITDFRWEEHADTSYIGAQSRFHSFWTEARGCLIANPTDCGIIRMGGWLDYGHLQVPDNNTIAIPSVDPSNPPNPALRRLHQAVKPGSSGLVLCENGDTFYGAANPCGRNGDVTWYGNHNYFSDGFNGEGYGPVNPANITQKLLYSDFGHPEMHGTWARAEIYSFTFMPWDTALGSKSPNHIDFTGYQDRYGKIVTNCTQPGLDCVPIQLIHVPVGHYLFRDSQHNPNLTSNSQISTDITPAGIPSWVVYNDTYVPDQTPAPSGSAAPTPQPSSTPSSQSSATTYAANLNGASNVPAVTTAGTATATLVLSPNQTMATVTVKYTNLSSNITAAEIHGPASPSQNAGVLFPLNFSAATTGVNSSYLSNLTAQQITDLKNGLWYITLKTTNFPAGEIRGQINLAPALPAPTGASEIYSANLAPVAGTGSSGSGKYTFTLMCNAQTSGPYAGQYLVYPSTAPANSFLTNLLGNPYDAHFHYTSSSVPFRAIMQPQYGYLTGNIPPVAWLDQLLTPPNDFQLSPGLNQGERDTIRFQPATGAPGAYINVHTNACPSCQGGEIRGDIVKVSGNCSSASPVSTPTPVPTPTPNSCPRLPLGDANCDGTIDIFDYSAVITHFNQSGTNISGDVNKDGVVDIFDYSIVVTHFGQ